MFDIIIEFLGTFIFILSILISHKYPEYAIPVITGLVLIAVMFIGVVTSGGHFNPAVSTAMLLNGTISLEKFVIYITAQMMGAIAAILFYNYGIKNRKH
jgi:aquaporin Z